MLRFSTLAGALLLAAVSSACRPHEIAAPSAPSVPRELRAPRFGLLVRPDQIPCERGDLPARPLTRGEAEAWLGPEFTRSPYSIDREEARVAQLAATLATTANTDPGYATTVAGLAIDHLELFERYAAAACAIEYASASPGEELDRLRAAWALAGGHLHAAMNLAGVALQAEHALADRRDDARCVRTVAAARLGLLAEAVRDGEALAADRPCSTWALVWLGHALDGAGNSAGARRTFERAAAIATGEARSPGSCAVAPASPTRGQVTQARPDPYAHTCSWLRYVRYRLAWLERRDTRAAALAEIAAELDPTDAWGGGSLHAAIAEDLARLGGG